MTAVKRAVFDGMTWPTRGHLGAIVWQLKYGDPTQGDRLEAAAVIDAYCELIGSSNKHRNDVANKVKAAEASR